MTDATLPLEDLQAKIGSPSLAVVHSFSLLGRTAQVSAAVPYAWGDASATIAGEPQSTSRYRLQRHALKVLMVVARSPGCYTGGDRKSTTKDNIGHQSQHCNTHRSVFP
ncbi:MAG: hypothetical protein MZV63_49330 [Marinilabiliales bacterium]|nr:hypothetical protein [Marinilabiliales bacterium]